MILQPVSINLMTVFKSLLKQLHTTQKELQAFKKVSPLDAPVQWQSTLNGSLTEAQRRELI
jgi:hypothetical protein